MPKILFAVAVVFSVAFAGSCASCQSSEGEGLAAPIGVAGPGQEEPARELPRGGEEG